MSDAASSSPTMTSALAGLALLVSSGHLAYAMTRSPSPATSEPGAGPAQRSVSGASDPAAPGDCRCEDAALRSEVVDLRRAIRALEGTAPPTTSPASPSDRSSASVQRPPLRTPTEHELATAVAADSALPPIDVFIDIPRGITLEQRSDGTIEATATDPELAGKQFVVVGLTKSGEAKLIRATAR